MRTLPPEALDALGKGAVKIRDFIWFEVKHLATGAAFSKGYWSHTGAVTADVIDPFSGLTVQRPFDGGGSLIQIDAIPLVSNLVVRPVEVKLSQVADANALMRGYDIKQGRVQIFRGLFHPNSLVQISPAYPRFVGYIDKATFKTPPENEAGAITLSCVPHSRELRRSNPASRSDAYQRERDPTDTFRQHAATVGTWELNWGG